MFLFFTAAERGMRVSCLPKTRCYAACKKRPLAKKDPATYQSWEKALMEAIGSTADWTDRKFLEPIIEFVYNE